jgi:hypothetical protein
VQVKESDELVPELEWMLTDACGMYNTGRTANGLQLQSPQDANLVYNLTLENNANALYFSSNFFLMSGQTGDLGFSSGSPITVFCYVYLNNPLGATKFDFIDFFEYGLLWGKPFDPNSYKQALHMEYFRGRLGINSKYL